MGYSRPMLIPAGGEFVMDPQRLRLAIPGLGGLVGFFLFPTLGAWFRLALDLLEDRSGLRPVRRLSGSRVLRAMVLTLLLGFFVVSMVGASGELRHVQAEAPVVGSSLRGLAVGVAFWAMYALGLSTLRTDFRRRSMRQRYGQLRLR